MVQMLRRNDAPGAPQPMTVLTIKKYSNRRLYDTERSQYITLQALERLVRDGTDVRVVDAKSREDLTQSTLLQLVIEGPAAKFLPVPVLMQCIRMHNGALSEFFSTYVADALQIYARAQQRISAGSPYFPFANAPMQAADAFLRLFAGGTMPGAPADPPAGPAPGVPSSPPPPPPPPGAQPVTTADLQALREEMERLKVQLRDATGGASAADGTPDERDQGGEL